MDNTREKLVEQLRWWASECDRTNFGCQARKLLGEAADYIENGVTVQELDGCIRCKDSQQMTVAISNKLVDGVNTGWLGGNLPARFCPFCGRRLPQPPKGE